MNLSFDIPTLVAVEAFLDTRVAFIVDEMQSAGGASLRTLQALAAAGTMDARYAAIGPLRIMPHDLVRATVLIETHGVVEAGRMAGQALGLALSRIDPEA